jgi:hypothetical protein
MATCTVCSAGYATAESGAANCTGCAVGRFQSSAGMAACELCDAGKYSDEKSSTACKECDRGYTSIQGSSTCAGLAVVNYFLFGGVATECPGNSVCAGNTFMPKPSSGYWVDRRSVKFAGDIYKCPRETCVPSEQQLGRVLKETAPQDVSPCWDMAAYTDASSSEHGPCDPNTLMCFPGSNSPLCGSCDEEFIYSSAERVCVACGEAQTRSVAIVFAALGVVVVAAAMFFSGAYRHFSEWVVCSTLTQIAGQVDSGALRVAWANYQVGLMGALRPGVGTGEFENVSHAPPST